MKKRLATVIGNDVRGALTARKDSLMEMEYTYATGSVPSYAGRISGRKNLCLSILLVVAHVWKGGI